MSTIIKITKQSFNEKVAFGMPNDDNFRWELHSSKVSLRNFANFSTIGKFPIECFWKGLLSMSRGQLQWILYE